MSEQGFTIIKCLIFQFSCTLLPIIHISSPPFFGFLEFRTKAGVWSHSKAKGLFCCTASAVLLISFNQSFLSRRRRGNLRSQPACSLKPLTFFIHDYPFEKQQHCIAVCLCASMWWVESECLWEGVMLKLLHIH